MKIKKTHKKKKIITTLVAVIVLVAGAATWYTVTQHNSDANETAETKTKDPKENPDDSIEDIKTTSPEESPEPSQDDDKTTANNSDPQAPVTTTEDGKGTVTVVTSTNTANGMVYIRGGINSVVSESGSCYAELTGPGGQSIRKETEILRSASTTDCKTIQIPASELTAGTWTYTLNYSSTTEQGSSNENSFTL